MKFHELPVGEYFEHQGKRYRKSEPLRAAAVDGHEIKFFARSAIIKPVGELPEQDEKAPASIGLEPETVREVLAEYHLAAIDTLVALIEKDDAELRRQVGGEMEKRYRAALHKLTL